MAGARYRQGGAWGVLLGGMPSNVMTTDTAQVSTGVKIFPLATGRLASAALSAYPDGAAHAEYVLAANGWPYDGIVTGFRNSTIGNQRFQAASVPNTYQRYWTGSAWSAWAPFLDASDLTAKGGSLWGTAVGAYAELPVGALGTLLGPDPSATQGVSYRLQPPSSGGVSNKKLMGWYTNPGANTHQAYGMPAPTATGTLADNSDTTSPFISFTTTAVINNAAGLAGATLLNRNWLGEAYFRFKHGGTISSYRSWCGLFTGDPSGSAAPALDYAAFRYDTVPDTTLFMRAITALGGTQTVTILNGSGGNGNTVAVPVAAGTQYDLAIKLNAGNIEFYVGGVLVATHTTNLPAVGTTLQPHAKVTTLVAGARAIAVGKIELRSL